MQLYVIGIGAGDPNHLTLAAVEAMRRVDVFVLMVKDGPGRDELIALRRLILERAVPDGGYRLETVASPARVPEAPDYCGGVDQWRRARAEGLAELFDTKLGPDQTAALLVWGDPCLYDGTIDSVEDLVAAGRDITFEVFPGITSIQALAARHRVALTRVGESVLVTTGRRLAAMDPAEITNCVVMLDSRTAFLGFADTDLEIYWGAYLGTADEVLIRGPLRDHADRIARTIETARARKGWIMDTYLLRRPRLA